MLIAEKTRAICVVLQLLFFGDVKRGTHSSCCCAVNRWQLEAFFFYFFFLFLISCVAQKFAEKKKLKKNPSIDESLELFSYFWTCHEWRLLLIDISVECCFSCGKNKRRSTLKFDEVCEFLAIERCFWVKLINEALQKACVFLFVIEFPWQMLRSLSQRIFSELCVHKFTEFLSNLPPKFRRFAWHFAVLTVTHIQALDLAKGGEIIHKQ